MHCIEYIFKDIFITFEHNLIFYVLCMFSYYELQKCLVRVINYCFTFVMLHSVLIYLFLIEKLIYFLLYYGRDGL